MTDYDIVQAMRRFGGSFARALAEACTRADDDNLNRIKTAFPDLWAEYDNLARLWADKQAKETA